MTDTTPRSGLDLQWIDETVRPQDDLFGHFNGKYLAEHEIPADRSQDGAFRKLVDQSEADVRAIVEEAASLDGREAQQIAGLFASFMDTERIEKLATEPLLPILKAIADINDRKELAAYLGRRQREAHTSLFGAYIDTDAKDSTRYIVHLYQSGLGLPDESFYSDEQYEEIRAKYVEHLVRLGELAGLPDPKATAETVMELETALAKASWDRVTNRDAEKTYNLYTFKQLKEEAPQFEWELWANAMGAPEGALNELVVRQPSFVVDAARMWSDFPIEQWKAWMTVRAISDCASYLHDAIVEESFDFYGRTLSGTPQLRERWKRGISLVEGGLGEAIGRIYVNRHFPAASKERMVGLVDNLVAAYRESISTLDWMSPATRERALEKLGKFTPKIGYPEKWKDYSAIEIDPDDLLGNVMRVGAWSTDHEFSKLGKEVDRDEWFMTPQTVNAYYNPQMNEIVFPAAILQPPFFDPDADDAVNYGGIGAVIGHEIGHGFDDQGSRYDGDGNLKDWWEEHDRQEFERRANALIEQYNELHPFGLPDNKVNGALTVGENIGDLGGLTIALKAYRISLNGAEAPVIDGYTGTQRVMLGWAQVWQAKTRKEEALRRLAIDPHSPPDLRCNAVVTNLDEFHEAFDVKEGDALFTPEDRRVRIW